MSSARGGMSLPTCVLGVLVAELVCSQFVALVLARTPGRGGFVSFVPLEMRAHEVLTPFKGQ